MSDTDKAVEALESSLRAVDASLSVLVVARENIINALRTIQTAPAPDPYATLGQEPVDGCEHTGDILRAGQGRGICNTCGEDIPWDG